MVELDFKIKKYHWRWQNGGWVKIVDDLEVLGVILTEEDYGGL
jgi:hypothetical protein